MTSKLHRVLQAALLGGLVLLLTACSPEPKPIVYGEDTCAHCIMSIADTRFGAELVTTTGKTYAFDSIECMAGYLNGNPEVEAQVHSLWVTDFQHPERLVNLDEAFVLHSPHIASPMGMNLAAFGPQISRDSVLNVFPGSVLDWTGVRALVADRAPMTGAMHGHGSSAHSQAD